MMAACSKSSNTNTDQGLGSIPATKKKKMKPESGFKKAQFCKHFKKGKCKNGDACQFSHQTSHDQRLALEKVFLRGGYREAEPDTEIEADIESGAAAALELADEIACASSSQKFVTWIKQEAEREGQDGKSWADIDDDSVCGDDCGEESIAIRPCGPQDDFLAWIKHQVMSPAPLQRTSWADESDDLD